MIARVSAWIPSDCTQYKVAYMAFFLSQRRRETQYVKHVKVEYTPVGALVQ